LKILDLRHSLDLIRTPDFSGLPALEKLILEDCIRLVQIHESIGDLQRMLILNLRNCTSLRELPEEMSRLISLQELVLDGCSNLDSLNMELEHHQGRILLQNDGIVASTLYITSLPLKLFFPSRFSARKMLRFTSFSLPRSLRRLDLSGTTIRSLPESIKDLGLLTDLYLRNCKMLQALPELPSCLWSLCVSFCYSLQRVSNLNPWTKAHGCDQLVESQDWMKQESIQQFDSHMFRIMEMVSAQIQPSRFQVLPRPLILLSLKSTFEYFSLANFIDIVLVVQIMFIDDIFNVVVYVFDEDEKLRGFYEDEEDKLLLQNEFVDNVFFKISSAGTRRICGFNLFTEHVLTSEYRRSGQVYLEIRNNTSGRSMFCQAFVFPMTYGHGVREVQSLMHRKLGANDPTFDNGDDVSISVLPHDPAIQIRRIGVRWLHEEEGNDDDIQSKDEVINARNSSDDDDDAHVAKIQIASHIVRNYYCTFRAEFYEGDFAWFFAKKGLEPLLI